MERPELNISRRIYIDDLTERMTADLPDPRELIGLDCIAGFAAWQRRAAAEPKTAQQLSRLAPGFRNALAPVRDTILDRVESGACSMAELQLALLDSAPMQKVQPWHHLNALQSSEVVLLELLPSVSKAHTRMRQVQEAVAGYVTRCHGQQQSREKVHAIAAGDILGKSLWRTLDVTKDDPVRDAFLNYFMQLFRSATKGYAQHMRQDSSFGANAWPALTQNIHYKVTAFLDARQKYQQGMYRPNRFAEPWRLPPGEHEPTQVIDLELLRKYRDIDDDYFAKIVNGPYTVDHLKQHLHQHGGTFEPKLVAMLWVALVNKPQPAHVQRELQQLKPEVAHHVEPLFTGEQASLIALGEAPLWMLCLAADCMRPDRAAFWLTTESGESVREDRLLLADCLRQAFAQYGFASCDYRLGTAELAATTELLLQQEVNDRMRKLELTNNAARLQRHVALLDITTQRQKTLIKQGNFLKQHRSLHWRVFENLERIRRHHMASLGERVVDKVTRTS